MSFAFDLRSQASTPSNHLCSTFLFLGPPQFLYQPPPGAQQLTRPDLSNVPHFKHVLVLAVVEVIRAVIGALTINSRSGTGRRVKYLCVVELHFLAELDPDDP